MRRQTPKKTHPAKDVLKSRSFLFDQSLLCDVCVARDTGLAKTMLGCRRAVEFCDRRTKQNAAEPSWQEAHTGSELLARGLTPAASLFAKRSRSNVVDTVLDQPFDLLNDLRQRFHFALAARS